MLKLRRSNDNPSPLLKQDQPVQSKSELISKHSLSIFVITTISSLIKLTHGLISLSLRRPVVLGDLFIFFAE